MDLRIMRAGFLAVYRIKPDPEQEVKQRPRLDSAPGSQRIVPLVIPEIPIENFEIFAAGLDHPECLAFDRDGHLWAGGEAGQVYRIAPSGDVTAVATLGGFCAGLAFSPADELLVCNSSLGIVQVQPTGKFTVF